ncbi:sugar transferase [bacterium]|nr:sugar transferase [bacterium]
MRGLLKRTLDFTATFFGIILLMPIFALLSLLITLDSPGGVLFRQWRVGRGGRLFRVYKFRTMVTGARFLGGGITSSGDPRITALGQRLRRWKLDELPNLLNVLLGEMSLVGPRPELPEFIALLTDEERSILRVPPGMTGLAQLKFIHEDESLTISAATLDYREQLLSKVRLDLQYVERAGAGYDIVIIFRTLFRLVFPSNDIP